MSSCVSAQGPSFCLRHYYHFNCFSSDNIGSCKSPNVPVFSAVVLTCATEDPRPWIAWNCSNFILCVCRLLLPRSPVVHVSLNEIFILEHLNHNFLLSPRTYPSVNILPRKTDWRQYLGDALTISRDRFAFGLIGFRRYLQVLHGGAIHKIWEYFPWFYRPHLPFFISLHKRKTPVCWTGTSSAKLMSEFSWYELSSQCYRGNEGKQRDRETEQTLNQRSPLSSWFSPGHPPA